MIALLWFLLTLFASPLTSKSRLEAENAALRYQLIVLRRKAEGGRSRPPHQRRSLVLYPAVSMVSVGAEGHHGHPSRDARPLASGRLSSLLVLGFRYTQGRKHHNAVWLFRCDCGSEH